MVKTRRNRGIPTPLNPKALPKPITPTSTTTIVTSSLYKSVHILPFFLCFFFSFFFFLLKFHNFYAGVTAWLVAGEGSQREGFSCRRVCFVRVRGFLLYTSFLFFLSFASFCDTWRNLYRSWSKYQEFNRNEVNPRRVFGGCLCCSVSFSHNEDFY